MAFLFFLPISLSLLISVHAFLFSHTYFHCCCFFSWSFSGYTIGMCLAFTSNMPKKAHKKNIFNINIKNNIGMLTQCDHQNTAIKTDFNQTTIKWSANKYTRIKYDTMYIYSYSYYLWWVPAAIGCNHRHIMIIILCSFIHLTILQGWMGYIHYIFTYINI